jgi:hypothetical protein
MKWNGDALQQRLKQQAPELLLGHAEQIERALGSVTCPAHGGHAEVKRVRTSGGWSINLVDPCCQKLRDAVDQAKAHELQSMAHR